MSIPAIQNLGPFRAGDSLACDVVITSDGEVVDLSGCTAMFEAARMPSADPVLSTEVSPATVTATVTSAAEGELEITAAAEDTEGLEGLYHYEIKIVDGTGNVHTPVVGLIAFEATVLDL